MVELAYEVFPNIRMLVNFVNKNKIKRKNIQHIEVT